MRFPKRSTPLFLLVLAIVLASTQVCCAQQKQQASPKKAEETGKTGKPAKAEPAKAEAPKQEAPKEQPAGEKAPEQGGSILSAEDVPIAINAEKIDEAGEALGKKIDAVGKGASVKYVSWVNDKAFSGITWLRLFVCVGLLLLVIAAERAVRHFLAIRMAKAEARAGFHWIDLVLRALSAPLSLFIRVYGVYWALSPIWSNFDSAAGFSLIHRAASKVADMGGTVALFWFIYRFVNVTDVLIGKWASSTDNRINDMLVPLVSRTVKIFIVVIGGIMVVQNMTGIEVGPLVASLGIGGLAFALAGKDSIANFLGSLTILLDKPFQVGERIMIDKHDGFVEGVGFRSTRLRTLSGNLVSIPNEKMINSPLENIGRRCHLRWQTDLGLTCDTPPEKVERAVEIVRDILHNHEGMHNDRPPRVYFNGFKDWSLNISVNAWYHPADYWKHQEWLQETCLEIMRRFREEGIEFAFPTQTVYQIDQAKQEEVGVPFGKPTGVKKGAA